MDTPLILLCILAFAFGVTALEEKLFGARARAVSSSEYLVFGVIFGPLALGLLSPDRVEALGPLVSVINGLLGFALGLPLRWSRRHSHRPGELRFSLVTTIGLALAVSLIAWVAFRAIEPYLPGPVDAIWPAAITLGAGAVAFSAQLTQRAIAGARSAGPVTGVLPVIADTGRVVAVAYFSIMVAARRGLIEGDFFNFEQTSGVWTTTPAWVVISIASGFAAGAIFHFFVGENDDDERLFVATVGLVTLASGIAHALEFSPLGVGLVAGITVANISPAADRICASVRRLDRPAAVMLMLLAGAMWRPIPLWAWLVPAGFVLLRPLVLRYGPDLTLRLHPELSIQHHGMGTALLGQSALAAAIAVNLGMLDQSVLTDIVVTILLASAVINDLWAGAGLRRVLRDIGETGRQEPSPGGGSKAARA